MATKAPNVSEEVWKDIPEWEGLYQASSLGRIRSLDRTIVAISRWGTPQKYKRPGKILKLKVDRDGYLGCHLNVSPRSKHCKAHQLVCMAFHRLPVDGEVVAHNNGVRDDNRPENLRWATTRENFHDRRAHGTWPSGENSGKAILDEGKVKMLREVNDPSRDAEFAEKFGVGPSAITHARIGHTWRHI